MITQQEAQLLALHDKDYRAVKSRHGDGWIVWCDASDHEVIFDEASLMRAKINAAITFRTDGGAWT